MLQLENDDFDDQNNMKMTLIDSDKGDTHAIEKNELCMVMLYADWCPHCTEAKPIFEKFAETAKENIRCFKINGSNDQNSRKTEIELMKRIEHIVKDDHISFPSFYFFINGKVSGKFDGERTVEGFNKATQEIKKKGYRIKITDDENESDEDETDDNIAKGQRLMIEMQKKTCCRIVTNKVLSVVDLPMYRDLFYWSLGKAGSISKFNECTKVFSSTICWTVTLLFAFHLFWTVLNLIMISATFKESGTARTLLIFSSYLAKQSINVMELVKLTLKDINDEGAVRKVKIAYNIYKKIEQMEQKSVSISQTYLAVLIKNGILSAGKEELKQIGWYDNIMSYVNTDNFVSEREEKLFLDFKPKINEFEMEEKNMLKLLDEIPQTLNQTLSFTDKLKSTKLIKWLRKGHRVIKEIDQVPSMLRVNMEYIFKEIDIPVNQKRLDNFQFNMEHDIFDVKEKIKIEYDAVTKSSGEWLEGLVIGKPIQSLPRAQIGSMEIGFTMPMFVYLGIILIWFGLLKFLPNKKQTTRETRKKRDNALEHKNKIE